MVAGALRAVLFALVLGGPACAKRDAPREVVTDAAASAAAAANGTTAIAAIAAPSSSLPVPLHADADAASTGANPCDAPESPPRSGKSIGHTSVVFELELASGQKVAWKPRSRRGKDRYKGEVAAYRLGRALGIDNVPPACLRVFDAKDAAAALRRTGDDAAKLLEAEAIAPSGKIPGAVIPWIDGLSFWPLEKEPLRTNVRTWLTSGAGIPPSKTELARQASTLVAFDFLTGNWDRYSGENVGLDKKGTTVLYIDNDAAFMNRRAEGTDALARNKAALERTNRFSRSFVANVRELDAARLTAALGDETRIDRCCLPPPSRPSRDGSASSSRSSTRRSPRTALERLSSFREGVRGLSSLVNTARSRSGRRREG